MFCNNCGKKLVKGSVFCDYCGYSTIESSGTKNKFKQGIGYSVIFLYKKIRSASLGNFFVIFLIFFLIGGGYLGYKFYNQIQEFFQKTSQELKETSQELEKTQDELSLMRVSTSKTISSQEQLLSEQKEKIKEQEDSLKQAKDNEALFQKTVENIQQQLENIEQTKVSSQVINDGNIEVSLTELSPSIVKIFCLTDSYSEKIQQGSGVLYKTSSNTFEPAPYYVQTSLHVVETIDGSLSRCLIALYPDYKSGDIYLLFESKDYRFYRKDVDVAFLKPRIIQNETRAGSLNDLSVFAQSESKNIKCSDINIGDRLTVLGYPGVGGKTLTVTDGIISGFDFYGGIRYIKTSAKIERGNSGGIAIKDSGCVLGIPTFVQSGEIESIGRILDLKYLFDVILK